MAEEIDNFPDIANSKTTITLLNGRVITLDSSRFVFNEASLNKYIEREAVWYDHFGNVLAIAEEELADAECVYEAAYAAKFSAKKEEGGSDKLVESIVKSNPEIMAFKKSVVKAKKNVKLLQQHLRSWDRCHDNAQSRGYMLRKEIDKLGGEIYHSKRDDYAGNEIDQKIDEIISKTQETINEQKIET